MGLTMQTIEMGDAEFTSVQVVGPGTVIGEDVVPAGQLAVVFDTTDSQFVLVGTSERVMRLMRDATTEVVRTAATIEPTRPYRQLPPYAARHSRD